MTKCPFDRFDPGDRRRPDAMRRHPGEDGDAMGEREARRRGARRRSCPRRARRRGAPCVLAWSLQAIAVLLATVAGVRSGAPADLGVLVVLVVGAAVCVNRQALVHRRDLGDRRSERRALRGRALPRRRTRARPDADRARGRVARLLPLVVAGMGADGLQLRRAVRSRRCAPRSRSPRSTRPWVAAPPRSSPPPWPPRSCSRSATS